MVYNTGAKKDSKYKYVLVHEMKLDVALGSVLPVFHVVTGCETVSQLT